MKIQTAIPFALLLAVLPLGGCQSAKERVRREPIVAPPGAVIVATLPPLPPKAAGTSVTVYIRMVIDKKYGVLAHLVGGKRDNVFRTADYDPAKPWWSNPLVVYIEPPLLATDAAAGADAQDLTGEGSSANVTIKLTLTPHAAIAVKSDPPSDGIKGTLTANISAAAEFFDGEWVEMLHVTDQKLTFTFDTCDPKARMEAVGHESRPIPAFALERHTRDHEKWEPRSNWPAKPESGDWRVVITAREATLQVTRFRTVAEPSPR